MTLSILFSDTDANWSTWETPLREALAESGISADLHRSYDTPERVDYVVYAPSSPLQDFSPYTRLKAVLSMWAGVESIQGNQTLTVPLARMVDPGLTEGMVEYVTGHILRYHLGIDRHITSNDRIWRPDVAPPLARNRRVSILGLGSLGMACANAAKGLGFDVAGWSRTPKTIDAFKTFSGKGGLVEILKRADILVLLLPLTDETEDLINRETLSLLPNDAVLINPGRGHLIVDEDLLDALEHNLAHATLDVFRTEPLPSDHPFWDHPRITVTPHIAAETRPATAARVIAQNIKRAENGQELLHLVDRQAGY